MIFCKIALLHPKAKLPVKGSERASGWDVSSVEDVWIHSGESATISVGLAFELPYGTEIQVRGRSGYAKKLIATHFGTVDEDYRGEVKVTLMNSGDTALHVEIGDRIAQIVVKRVEDSVFEEVPYTELKPTGRGTGGFGSTGIK